MNKIDWSKTANNVVAALTTKPGNVYHPTTTFLVEFFRLGCTIRGTGVSGQKLCAIDDYWELIERPVPAWNGEGLPPIGTVCEFYDPRDEEDRDDYEDGLQVGAVVTILGHYENGRVEVAAFTYSPANRPALIRKLGCARAGYYRPIRTPEQIEAEEREKAIEEMVRVDEKGSLSRTYFCELLYDAGYRKQVTQ